MSSATANQVLAHLANLLDASVHRELSDRQLIERFARQHDQQAFSLLG